MNSPAKLAIAQVPPVITAGKRRELARMFERAKGLALGKPPNFAGAHQVLAEMCTVDPGNTLFVQGLLDNLYSAQLKTAKAWPWQVWFLQAEFEKAVRERRYVDALSKGWTLLGERPTLRAALVGLAEICDALDHLQTQLLLLETAHYLAPHDASTAELFARALASAGQFEQAARLRSGEAPPMNVARRPAQDVSFTDVESALATSQWNLAHDLLVALSGAGGGDLRIRELFEELELGRARERTKLAEEQASREPTPRHKQLVEEVIAEQRRIELGVAFARHERFSADPAASWELAQCLARIGNFSEARRYLVPLFQDPEWKIRALVAQGENWQNLRQFDQALDLFQQAIAATEQSPADDFQRKALYRGAVLAEAMGRLTEARDWLERLVAADSGYKDAAVRLVKLRAVCDKGGFSALPGPGKSTQLAAGNEVSEAE